MMGSVASVDHVVVGFVCAIMVTESLTPDSFV